MESASPSYTEHRHPVEILAHCGWPDLRFPLAFRQVEELMLRRGVTGSYGAVRRRCLKFGQGGEAQGVARARQFGGGKHLSGSQTGQHREDVSVFVLGAFRQRRHEVRQA
ncbi:hypothetical protein [Streptomyces decoyicus]